MWIEFQVCSNVLLQLLWDIDAKKNDLQKDLITLIKHYYTLNNSILNIINLTFTLYIPNNKLDGCNKPHETIKAMNSRDRQTRSTLPKIADLEHSINLIQMESQCITQRLKRPQLAFR